MELYQSQSLGQKCQTAFAIIYDWNICSKDNNISPLLVVSFIGHINKTRVSWCIYWFPIAWHRLYNTITIINVLIDERKTDEKGVWCLAEEWPPAWCMLWEIYTRFRCAPLCSYFIIHNLSRCIVISYPYSSGLIHWLWGDCMGQWSDPEEYAFAFLWINFSEMLTKIQYIQWNVN